MNKQNKHTKFDVLDYLKDEESIAAYLEAALEENDPRVFLMAIGDIAKARGVNEIAKKTGVNRENFYRSFSGKQSPRFDTVYSALDTLGLKITLTPKEGCVHPRKHAHGC